MKMRSLSTGLRRKSLRAKSNRLMEEVACSVYIGELFHVVFAALAALSFVFFGVLAIHACGYEVAVRIEEFADLSPKVSFFFKDFAL